MSGPDTKPDPKRRALGRGLDALLPAVAPAQGYGDRNVFTCPIERIVPQGGQPRRHFDSQKLDGLAASIREHGLLEPLVVRRAAGGDKFELALIENVQREDLNAIELAEAYERLMNDHGYTQEALATRVGKDRTTIANALRLIKLPPKVRARVIAGELSEGHARALLGAGDAATIEQLADKVVRGGLSVRATEALVRARAQRKKGAGAEAGGDAGSASIR